MRAPLADDREMLTHEGQQPPASSKRTKTLIWSVTGLCGALCVVIMFILFTAGSEKKPEAPVVVYPGQDDPSFPCVSADCTMVSGNMLGNMNTEVNACDDAYQYSCGRFLSTFELPEEETTWTLSFSEISKRNRNTLHRLLDDMRKDSANQPKLKAAADDSTFRGAARTLLAAGQDPWDAMLAAFYDKCMDTAALDKAGKQPLVDVLTKYLPFLLKDAAELSAETAQFAGDKALKGKLLAERLGVYHNFGLNGFFGSYIAPNVIHPELQQTMFVVQSGLGLEYAFYSKDPENKMAQKFQQGYKTHLAKLFALMGSEETAAAKKAQDVLDLEFAMREIFLSPEQRRDTVATTNPISVAELSALTGDAFDFATYWKHTNEKLAEKQKLKDTTELIVESKDFYTRLSNFFATADWQTLHDYLLAHTMTAFGDYLSAEWRDEFDRYHLDMSGAKPPARWRTCLENTQGTLSWILARRFVQKAFEPARKDLATDILNKVETAFGEQIKNVEWMDATTKEKALAKLALIRQKIGYPEWLLNDAETYFNRFYGAPSAEVTSGSWLEGVVHLMKESSRYQLSQMGMPVDKAMWGMDPATVNAYYSPDQNEIVFPASILQPPFLYLPEAHAARKEVVAFMALNYGAYGAVVGHEITHGFDDQGAQFDGYGQMVKWWTPESEAQFNKATQCVADQYEAYAIEDGTHLHGKLTLGENIADNGGFRTSFRALKAALTEEEWNMKPFPGLDLTTPQLFMLSFSQIWCSKYTPQTLRRRVEDDPHSPGPFRVQGTLSNSPAFAELFQCKAGQTLNPEKRCTVW